MRSASKRTRLIEKLVDAEYRKAFVEQFVSTNIPFQIRGLREARGWSQRELGRRAGMSQSAISRLENLDYGQYSLATLLRLASVFDVAIMVKFIPFRELLSQTEDLSPAALAAKPFDDELEAIRAWASGEWATTSNEEVIRLGVRSPTFFLPAFLTHLGTRAEVPARAPVPIWVATGSTSSGDYTYAKA